MISVNNVPARAAFEIVKGSRRVLTLSEAQVADALDPNELLDGLERGFGALARNQIQCPPRPKITVPDKGFSLSMQAWQPGMQICVKIVNVFEGNLKINLPNHLAIINLFDPETGACTCVMDGTYITGVRTAASAVVSHKLLSRPDSKIATIVGAGVQGREHLRFLSLIRDFEEIQICDRYFEHAERLARKNPKARAVRNIEEAIRRSDAICLAAHSAVPVIQADWVKSGTHVSSVGFYPPDGELPRQLPRNNRLFVESSDSFAAAPVGCGELSGIDSKTGTLLGEVVNDSRKGRRDALEITVYKAMGVAMEDMVAANLAYRRALAVRVSSYMDW